MPGRSRPTFKKRQKELKRQEKQRDKADRRDQKKQEPRAPGGDNIDYNFNPYEGLEPLPVEDEEAAEEGNETQP